MTDTGIAIGAFVFIYLGVLSGSEHEDVSGLLCGIGVGSLVTLVIQFLARHLLWS